MKKIKTFIINLEDRKDRLKHALSQFDGKKIFDKHIFPAIKKEKGNIGLWESIIECVKDGKINNLDYIIICEDDHKFTKDFSQKKLKDYIFRAEKLKADIILGGVSFFQSPIKKDENLYWVEKFTGTQFMVIFKNFYDELINAEFKENDSADFKIRDLTEKHLVTLPFISIQKDFLYSDVTLQNVDGKVKKLFRSSRNLAENTLKIEKHYQNINNCKLDFKKFELNSISIPTYIINLPERKERLAHITEEFRDRSEFSIEVVDACKHKIGAVGLWLSIRKIIKKAIENDDDVIVIVEDDHIFTKDYFKNIFLENVIQAFNQNVDYLSGGIGNFINALKVSEHRYWIDFAQSTQFIVVYRDFFQTILNAEYDDSIVADLKLSDLSVNKQVFFPFISEQKDFGYSDVTDSHNETKGLVQNMFQQSKERFQYIENNQNEIFK